MPSAIVPAAGAGSRFGGAKLVADVDGMPMLHRTIDALLGAGISEVVVITSPANAWTRDVSVLQDSRVRTVVNPDPSRGMFSSIQIGAAAITSGPVAVLPGDMPFVCAETVEELLQTASRTGGIVCPRFEGRRGHPVVFPRDVINEVVSAPPTSTLKHVLMANAGRYLEIDVRDRGVVRDVDVVEDLAR